MKRRAPQAISSASRNRFAGRIQGHPGRSRRKAGPRRSLAVVLLGGDAGCRRNEIAAVNLEDIDFRTARITVRRNVFWKNRTCVETKPKGKQAANEVDGEVQLSLKGICN